MNYQINYQKRKSSVIQYLLDTDETLVNGTFGDEFLLIFVVIVYFYHNILL